MTGGSRFPAIGELPYLLTLAGHGFYWLRIPVHQQRGGTGLPASEGASRRRAGRGQPGRRSRTARR